MPIIGFFIFSKFPCYFRQLQIYGLIEKRSGTCFLCIVFIAFPTMERHPMEGHSWEIQLERRLTTGKKVAIEGDMHLFK